MFLLFYLCSSAILLTTRAIKEVLYPRLCQKSFSPSSTLNPKLTVPRVLRRLRSLKDWVLRL